MEHPLSHKVALVTGGSRGIGMAITQKLKGLGATTVICGRDPARLEMTARKLECESFVCDVTEWNSVAALADRIRGTFNRLDILINNAGIGSFSGPLHMLSLESWDEIFNTNLRGVFYMVRALAPLLIASGGGDIINISSIAGRNALPNGAAYSASKWALNGLSYSMAEELRSHNIRVAVVSPGSTNTEFSTHAAKHPERMLQGEDVAHVIEMLLKQMPRSFVSEVIIRPTQKP